MNRLLHIAPFFEGSTAIRRNKVFTQLGYEVTTIDLDKYIKFWKRGLISVSRKLPISLFNIKLNQQVIFQTKLHEFDYIICEKPKFLFPSTLKHLKERSKFLVHFSPDDYFNPTNRGWFDTYAFSIYDILVTNKLHNVQVLGKKFSGSKVYHMLSGGPEAIEPDSSHKATFNISFIGQFEKDRYNRILELSELIEYPIDIFGPDWDRVNLNNKIVVNAPVWGNKYIDTIRASKVNLCFLRKSNFDTSTTRTFEIVSSGGLMIAERTEEHMSLFEENKEVLFFSSTEELIKHVNFCLDPKNEIIVNQMKHSAFLRYRKSGYSDMDNWKKFFDIF